MTLVAHRLLAAQPTHTVCFAPLVGVGLLRRGTSRLIRCSVLSAVPRPSRPADRRWSASRFEWRFASSKARPDHADHVMIPDARDFQTVEGISKLHHLEAKSKHLPELHGSYLPCFCVHHRREEIDKCQQKHWVYANSPTDEPEVFMIHQKRAHASVRETRSKRRCKDEADE